LIRVVGVYCIRNWFTTDLVDKLKTEHTFRIYPVELAVELETASRLPTGEYTTQLDSKCCEFNTHRATPTQFLSRIGVGTVYSLKFRNTLDGWRGLLETK